MSLLGIQQSALTVAELSGYGVSGTSNRANNGSGEVSFHLVRLPSRKTKIEDGVAWTLLNRKKTRGLSIGCILEQAW